MKNMLKILGIVLTLAMLSGLLMAVAPVSTSAADLSWSNQSLPQVSVGTSANVFAFTGDGKTLYAWTAGTVNPTITTAGKLYRSTDGGYTWSNSGIDTTSTQVLNLTSGAITKLVVNPASTNDIIATDGTNVYRSINGGQTFYVFNPTLPAGSVINSIDAANSSAGLLSILVSFSAPSNGGGVALFDSSIGTWRTVSSTSPASASASTALGSSTTWGAADGLAAAFSPNYTNDATIVVVTGNTTAVAARGMVVTSTSDWNQSGGIKDAILKQSGTPITAIATTTASIALPSDYVPTSSVQNRVFIGIGDTTGANTANGNDVYRVNASSSSATAYALGAAVNVSSVAYVGTSSAGALAVGQYAGNASFPTGSPVLSTTQVSSNTPTWNTSSNSPSGSSPLGAATMVKFKPGSTATAYTLYAGTAGTNSELATSTDLNAFWGVGLFSFSSYATVSLGNSSGYGGKEIWQVVRDGTFSGPTSNPSNVVLFYSSDAGNTWKAILNNGNNAAMSINRSPAYATDKTIIMTQAKNSTNTTTDTSKQVIKTSDGGLTWTLLNTPGNVSIVSISVVDANSYWAASQDRIQLSSSSTYATIEGKTPAPGPLFASPAGFFTVATTTGEFYLSTDNGATFTRLGNVGQFTSNPTYTRDNATKTIYAIDQTTRNVMKWTVGTDSSWQIYMNSSVWPDALKAPSNGSHPLSSISKSADGFWYIVSSGNYDIVNGAAVSNDQIWATSDLQDITASPIPSTVSTLGGVIPAPFGAGATIDANKNTAFYTTVSQGTLNATTGAFVAATTPASPNGYTYKVMTFTNTLAVAPKTTAPDGKTPVGTPSTSSSGSFALVNFSWAAANYNGAKYDFQLAFDKDFNSIVSAQNGAQYNTYATGTSNTGTAQSLLDLKFIPSNSVSGVPLTPGQTYYWRVRNSYPVVSQWSTPIQFSTVVVSSTSGGIDQQGRISPVNGATGVNVTPAITWGTVPGATGYDFKLSTDPTFADASKQVDSFTNKNTTVFTPSKALSPNTTYYWEVRALNGTATGDWVISAFTTQATAQPTGTGPTTGGQPTIIVTVPAQSPGQIIVTVPPNTQAPPAPATPAYIWVIIAIGAVLVIAVIVLIARTRRV